MSQDLIYGLLLGLIFGALLQRFLTALVAYIRNRRKS